MIYIVIITLILVFYMIYHIVCCHSEIEYHIGMSEFYQRCRDDEHDRHMESLDKIISLEKEIRKLKFDLIEIYGDSVMIKELFKDEGFVDSMEPTEKPIDKVVNCEFRACGPIIPIRSVPDIIKGNADV